MVGAVCGLLAAAASLAPRRSDLHAAAANDRGSDGSTVDLSYTLNVPPNWWKDQRPPPTYSTVMEALHGSDVWRDPGLPQLLKLLKVVGDPSPKGSSLNQTMLRHFIDAIQPRFFLEVGVFRGSTSTYVARLMDRDPRLNESFVVSMDTWLLDLRFTWSTEAKRRYMQHTHACMCMSYMGISLYTQGRLLLFWQRGGGWLVPDVLLLPRQLPGRECLASHHPSADCEHQRSHGIAITQASTRHDLRRRLSLQPRCLH